MAVIGGILALVGFIASAVGGIMVLIKAFQNSVLWGLGSLIVPFVIIVFAIMNWDECKKGLLIAIGGVVLAIIGTVLGGLGAATVTPTVP
jgi:hypothetical protein